MALMHHAKDREFPPFVAVAAVAAELAVIFIGATLPTPLYPLYRAAFSFSGLVLTLIYAVYVLGNLVALLILGRLSDQIGRKSITLPAIAFGIASTVLFAFASSVTWLFAARILSGIATGLAAGAATAWIAELSAGKNKLPTAKIASAANFAGLAAAPLASGLLAEFAPWPLRLSYVLYLVLLVGIAGVITFVPETVANPKKHLREISVKPRLGLPQEIRPKFVSPALTGFVIFALIGFYAALIPSLLSESLHQTSPALSGAVVFQLFAVAVIAVGLTGGLASRTAMLAALLLLPVGTWLLVAAQLIKSLPLLFVATTLGGIAGALGYRGSLDLINTIAPSNQRSEVVSSYLIAVYSGNALPVIGIGLLSTLTSSIVAHISLAALITVLAVFALVAERRSAIQGKNARG
ncbi:MFS transporter [Rhizobium leucaenae]|uniref:MFS family permease n=1 Tax=Rhizobium leucaenae TaxID=29450 RepID=A0A7W6ZRB2_9HYPH|nr:MFS transporter [Rhizobium leucaenae]MBB4566848.1 MFS family permease [Rhizobium leucaenae]MBB6300656.1 MFS family permease [Rhizobium leucaenae]